MALLDRLLDAFLADNVSWCRSVLAGVSTLHGSSASVHPGGAIASLAAAGTPAPSPRAPRRDHRGERFSGCSMDAGETSRPWCRRTRAAVCLLPLWLLLMAGRDLLRTPWWVLALLSLSLSLSSLLFVSLHRSR